MRGEIPHYTGWTPRSMRAGRNRHEPDRGSKRSRLGNSKDRKFYVSSKAHKIDPINYVRLCQKADNLNGNRRATV